ncbi:MAG: substrate-binding domain-containing protein [Bacteroidaceae bacterium]|nr:substrate-binding domain-containing protein [Bacteroidaceae bacterium]
MKKRLLTYMAVLSVLLTACSSEKTYKIGVSQCGSGQWREKVNREMLAAQHLYERNVRVTIACAYDDTEQQIRQIDSLVESGIDLLVVAPNEAAPIVEAISKVRQLGIPVIYFDRKASTDDYTAFIGASNVEVGRIMGDFALQVAGDLPDKEGKPLVMEITGAMSTSPAQERHNGFSTAMARHDELQYVCKEADWTSEEACRMTEEQIRTGQVPDVVFCHNDGMATGVYKAAVEADMEDRIKIMGIDGLPGEGIEYVQFGHQVGTYIYPTHGEKIVRLALDILTGKPYERENTLQGMIVTEKDVNIVDLNSREQMKQNNDLITIQDKLEDSLVLYDTQHKILIASLATIILLVVAIVMIWRAYVQTRKAIRQRQTMNEEQTLFYTDASNRKLHDIFQQADDDLPPPRSQDMLFAEQLNDAIRKHMSNPNLKMDDLGEEIGMGRVQLYRKVKAVTGQTPVELLRQMRLQRAYALLTSTTKTVAEIAFEVGFNTPGYFSKCFREQYGKLPMDLRQEDIAH